MRRQGDQTSTLDLNINKIAKHTKPVHEEASLEESLTLKRQTHAAKNRTLNEIRRRGTRRTVDASNRRTQAALNTLPQADSQDETGG